MNQSNDRPLVIAHRGGAAEAPENTRAAFRRVIDRGFDGVEWDVRMSRDGVPVVIHDEAVAVDASGARRPVDQLTAAELGRLDLAWTHGPAAAGESVPTLADVLALPWGPTVLMVEVKPTRDDDALGTLVAAAIGGLPHAARTVVASFSPAVLTAVRRRTPERRLLGLIDADTPASLFSGLPLFGFGVDAALVTPSAALAWCAQGRALWSWTVKNTGQVKTLRESGVVGLITDIPTEVRALAR